MRVVKDTFRIFQRTSRFPTVYERMFIGIKGQYTSPYLDDILCYRKSFGERLHSLRTVLRRLKSYGIKRKTEKWVFFKKGIEYLVKIISEDWYKDSLVNTKALETLSNPPKNIGDLGKRMGFLGYYRQSICDFSRKGKPLHDILCVPKQKFHQNQNIAQKSPKDSDHRMKKLNSQNITTKL